MSFRYLTFSNLDGCFARRAQDRYGVGMRPRPANRQKVTPELDVTSKQLAATFGNLRDLQMGIDELDWLAPWRPLATEQKAIGLQRQLDREVTARHPLFGREATVKGRRIDNDDIVVVLFDGAYVVVHLTWSVSDGGPFADNYPEWLSFGSLEDFVAAMLKDSRAYGDN
jgi:hypothetical protein